MSLRDFQRALGDFVASPELCRAALANPQSLAGEYDLTEREWKRLLHSAGQRGMRVCWSLHRANRLGPLHAVLPLTSRALGPHLRRELDAFWNGALPDDLQFRSEAERFAAFLLGRVQDGTLDLPVLADLAPFELALADLRFLPRRAMGRTLARAASRRDARFVLHPFVRLLRFRHDPERLLDAAMRERPFPTDLARGDFFVLLDGKSEGIGIRLLEEPLGRLIEAFKLGVPPACDPFDLDTLQNAGLIARWPAEGFELTPDDLA